MKKDIEQQIFKKSIELYEEIAEHYSETPGRNKPRVNIINELTAVNGRVLDVGCGNGITSLEVPELAEYTGVDVSNKFIEIAKQKFPEKNFIHYEGITLPFNDNTFDWVLSFAALHHIPGSMRAEVVKEMKRVLKPGGKIVVSVWNLWDIHFMKYFLSNFWKTATRKNKMDWNDLEYPWKSPDGEVVGYRYFHMFRMHELKKIFKKEGLKVKEAGEIKFSNAKFRNLLIKLEK
jgi:ubiquinone/menaquinone biosynthesis C-methylase UbiE